MPRWKRNLIIAAVILAFGFVWIPSTTTGLLAQAWHSLLVIAAHVKHANHWR